MKARLRVNDVTKLETAQVYEITDYMFMGEQQEE